MNKVLHFFLLSALVFSALTYAGQSDSKDGYRLLRTNDANGGAGLAGKNGQRGMNGCPGGTRPSPDGRYYLPGTHEECNSGHKSSPHQNRYSSGAQGYERA